MIVTSLSESNFYKSLSFYVNILGFKIEYQRIHDKFAYLSYGKAQIMIEEINGNWNVADLEYPFGRGINFQIETKNIQKIQTSLMEHNIKPFKDIFESKYHSNNQNFKQLEILILDPDGYLLRFSQDI